MQNVWGTHPAWEPWHPLSSCTDPAEQSALWYACPVTGKTYCSSVTMYLSVATVFKPNVLTFSSFEANRDSIPSFNLWYSWSDEINIIFGLRLMSAKIFWHVTECLVTDMTAMLIWINKQSKVTMTAPPCANKPAAFRMIWLLLTTTLFSATFNCYDHFLYKGRFNKTNKTNTYRDRDRDKERDGSDIISYPFKSDGEGHAEGPVACAFR